MNQLKYGFALLFSIFLSSNEIHAMDCYPGQTSSEVPVEFSCEVPEGQQVNGMTIRNPRTYFKVEATDSEVSLAMGYGTPSRNYNTRGVLTLPNGEAVVIGAQIQQKVNCSGKKSEISIHALKARLQTSANAGNIQVLATGWGPTFVIKGNDPWSSSFDMYLWNTDVMTKLIAAGKLKEFEPYPSYGVWADLTEQGTLSPKSSYGIRLSCEARKAPN